jgi:hypothetical protein
MSTFQLQSPLRDTKQINNLSAPTGGVDAGEFRTVNNVNGFVLVTTDPYGSTDLSLESNRQYVLITEAPLVLAEKNAGAINAGVSVFYNSSTKKVTTSSTGNTYVGYAVESVGSAATQVRIAFNGSDRT